MTNKTKWQTLYELGEPLMVFNKSWQPVTKCPSKYAKSAIFRPADNSDENLVAIFHKLGNIVKVTPIVEDKFEPAAVLEPLSRQPKPEKGKWLHLGRPVLGIEQNSDYTMFNYG